MVMQLGINLSGCDKAQWDVKHSNLFGDVGGWAVTSSGQLIPRTAFTPPDFTAPGATPSVPCLTHPATWGYAPAGNYTFLGDGAGTLSFGETWSFDGTPGQSHVHVFPPGTTFSEGTFSINAVNGGNPLRKLRMLGPLSDDSSFFTPSYLEALRGFKVLRGMDWLIGVQSSWNPYNPPTPGVFGFAAEITDWSQADLRPGRGPRGLCDLVLALKRVHGVAPDLWVNIPYRCASMTGPTTASVTAYIEAFGAYCASRLPPEVQVYVEWANEVWNYSIYNNYLVSQGTAFAPAQSRYADYAVLSAATWEAFERGFGRNCIRVLNAQYVWPENTLLPALDFLVTLNKRVDVISSAPYFFTSPYTNDWLTTLRSAWTAGDHSTALGMFFDALHAGIATNTTRMAQWKQISQQYGCRNCCYEGGTAVPQSFFTDTVFYALWNAAIHDPRMATEVLNYINTLALTADLFNWFDICGNGSWGAATDAGDWDDQRVVGMRNYMGLPTVGSSGPYTSDGYGSLGDGYIVSPKTTPAITWTITGPLVYGNPLSSTQLDATTSVAGHFLYTPPAGTLLNVGASQTLEATFIPDDMASYDIATAATTIDVIPGPNPSGNASFVRQDPTTQGNWLTAYGNQGFTVESQPSRIPPYAAISFSKGVLGYTWDPAPTDVRALQLPDGSGRIAATWYISIDPGFTIDVVFGDGLDHLLAFYFIDWDSGGRVQSVQVKDAQNGAIYDMRTIQSFSGGLYLVYKVSGHVVITITRTQGPNTVVSGIFLDAGSVSPSRRRRFFSGLGRRGF